MIVDIKGTSFVNKGAELMLHAVIQETKKRLPEAIISMVPWGEELTPYKKRAELGLYQNAYFEKYGIQFGELANLIPISIRKKYGIVLEKDVDVVLDASGLAYSDKWGSGLSVQLANSSKRWKKHGTKLILLPQAFGPFKDPKIIDAVKTIGDNAELIFAREKASYDILIDILGERDNIKIAPDFTNLVEFESDSFKKYNRSFCIVPNYRMIDKTSTSDKESYLPFLCKALNILKNKGEDVFLLIHEGKSDLKLAKEIASKFEGIEIIIEDDPLKIKGILGSCKGTIGSRFHGLVSALSQGVPSIGTGWSHKYEMLFNDYNFPEGIIDLNSYEDLIFEKIEFLTNEELRTPIVNKLNERSKILKIQSNKMWDLVFSTIQR